MKKAIFSGIVLILALLSGCAWGDALYTQPSIQETTGETIGVTADSKATEPTVTESIVTEPTVTAPTEPEHSALYIPTVSVEEVVRYFNEVCLNAEIVNAGDPTKLQRWETPIQYFCDGASTNQDKQVLDGFVAWLNTVEGFPGIKQTQDPDAANLRIYFREQAEYLDVMGSGFAGTDGGVTFWYNGANEITHGVIGYRTDIDQYVRNSVVLEEIYNGLGPINDTQLRNLSVIFAGYSTPQSLSEVDKLILKLLYHPQMQCGMNGAQCEAIIRQLYY